MSNGYMRDSSSMQNCKHYETKTGKSLVQKQTPEKINKQYRVHMFLPMALALLAVPQTLAQAAPAAVTKVPLSFFAGVSGVYTGLAGGRNLGITAGVDLRLKSVFSLYPAVELRGTYPFVKGNVDSQKNVLAGLKVGRSIGRFTPYGNILFGLGQISYDPRRANPSNTFAYEYSSSNVISPGAGIDIDLTPAWGIKADGQLARYSTPVTQSGHIYAKSITVGVVYHLFGGRGPQ